MTDFKQWLFVVALTGAAAAVAAFSFVFIYTAFDIVRSIAIVGGFIAALVAGGMTP